MRLIGAGHGVCGGGRRRGVGAMDSLGGSAAREYPPGGASRWRQSFAEPVRDCSIFVHSLQAVGASVPPLGKICGSAEG